MASTLGGTWAAQTQGSRVSFFKSVGTADTVGTENRICANLCWGPILPASDWRVLQKLFGCQNNKRELAFKFCPIIWVENRLGPGAPSTVLSTKDI
jgi:hypothetical protein